MGNKRIETLAVNAVKDKIVMSDYLEQYIDDNDKEPSWDGEIYLYYDKNNTKDKLKGRVAVQIKGLTKKNLSEKEIKYSVLISDLKNYLNDGGVIFFVVYITEDYNKKIYYSELLPIKIRNVLDKSGNGKSARICLKEFPDDSDQIRNIFFWFYDNSKKQSSFTNSKLLTIQELQEQGILESIRAVAAGNGINKDDPKAVFLSNDVYLYAKIKGSPIEHPLPEIPVNVCIEQEFGYNISIHGIIYFESYKCIRNKNTSTIKIGDSIKIIITFNEDLKNHKCIYDMSGLRYEASNKLRSLVRDLKFILEAIENKKIEINGNDISIDIKEEELADFDINQQKDILEYHEELLKVFDLLNIRDDVDLSKLTKTDYANIDILIKAFVDKVPISHLKKGLEGIQVLTIEDIRIALIFIYYKNKEDTYYVYDFFDFQLEIRYKDEKNEIRKTSQYPMLKADDYTEIANIRLNVLLPSYKRYENDSHTYTLGNCALLNLLSAYDKSLKTEFLETAKEFSDWLIEGDSKDSYKLHLLNKLQIIKRERELSKEEKNELIEIINKNNLEDALLVGAYLLLESQDLAGFYFKKLTHKEKENFKQYPIYRFWNSKIV